MKVDFRRILGLFIIGLFVYLALYIRLLSQAGRLEFHWARSGGICYFDFVGVKIDNKEIFAFEIPPKGPCL